jgi:tetratricopeptide (TPR) repeat protein
MHVVAFDNCFSNWSLAVHDLNSILEVEPLHAEARFYRGRVHAELHQWQAALVDFSAAIHLNPNDALAFYHRGCLLRK